MSLKKHLTALAAVAWLVGCGPSGPPPEPSTGPPRRLVAMSPAISEILYALGLGDRVVGVTRYCAVPPDRPAPAKVGGYVDPDWEALVALRPDLVLTMESHAAVVKRLHGMGISTLQVDHSRMDGILASFESIAAACGVPERGAALKEQVEGRLDEVAEAVRGRPKPRVLVVIGRDLGEGRIATVWAAGRQAFYEDILRLAGGVNAIVDETAAYPELGPEGLLAVDPDVIVDVVTDLDERGITMSDVAADWNSLAPLRALRDSRIQVVSGDFLVIPGPRVAEVVVAFARALHPEAELPD